MPRISPIALYGFFNPSLFNLINKSKLSFTSSLLKHVSIVSETSPESLISSDIGCTIPTIVNSLFCEFTIFSPSCIFSDFFNF